jgi:hypothetical protein
MTMNTTFATLISVYRSAEALVTYLKSAEGGKLVVRDFRAPGDPYVLIHYDKDTSDMTHINTNIFRSIVWNMETNLPVSISPSRGIRFSRAPNPNSFQGFSGFRVEEFVDGVMLNAFYDARTAAWQISSRTQIGATGSFYGKRPFIDLFHETCKVQGIDLATFDTSLCYSFVLNHPEERIVVPALYGTPTLTLVEAYRIHVDTGLYELVDATIPNVKKPAIYPTLETLEGIATYVAARNAADRYNFQGVVLKCFTGNYCHRYKNRSLLYSHARFLRGNQSKLPFRWLELWSNSGRAFHEYLEIYPEEAVPANEIVERFKACTQTFHDLFIQVYKKHELPLGAAPQKYRKLIWEARQRGVSPYFPALRDFMNHQDTARKLWLVNYEVRYTGSTPAGITESKEDLGETVVQVVPVEEVEATSA